MTSFTKTKTGTVEVINLNNNNTFSAPLLESARQEYWMGALSPLKWILFPIGIQFPLSNNNMNKSHSICNRLWQLWSYLYVVSYAGFPLYQFSPRYDAFFGRGNTGQQIIWCTTNTILLIAILYIYYFIRCCYLNGYEYFQSLWLNLFECLNHCCIIKNNCNCNDSRMIDKYRNYIYNCCRLYVIIVWCLFILIGASWCGINSQVIHEKQSVRQFQITAMPIVYDIQIWLPMLVYLTIFVITMQMLWLHYCVFSVRLYHTFDGCKLFENYRIYVNSRSSRRNTNDNIMYSKWKKIISIFSKNKKNDEIDYYGWFPEILTVFTYDSTFSELQCLNEEKNCIQLFDDIGEIKLKYFELILLFSKHSQIWKIVFVFQLLIFCESIVGGIVILYMYELVGPINAILSLLAFWSVFFLLFITYMAIIAYVNQSCCNLKKLLCLADCHFGNNNNNNNNNINSDNNNTDNRNLLRNRITQADILYFHNLIDMHQCTFNVWGIQITFNKVAVLFVAGCSTVLSFGFEKVFSGFR